MMITLHGHANRRGDKTAGSMYRDLACTQTPKWNSGLSSVPREGPTARGARWGRGPQKKILFAGVLLLSSTVKYTYVYEARHIRIYMTYLPAFCSFFFWDFPPKKAEAFFFGAKSGGA